MAFANLVLTDHKNKLYQTLLYLREEVEFLIHDNIEVLNQSGYWLTVQEYDMETTPIELERTAFKLDIELYDRVIFEYNQSHEQGLVRWK